MLWKATGISLSTQNFKLQILCAAPLYLPVQWQCSLTFQKNLSLANFFRNLFHLDANLVFLLLTVTFFSFQNQLYFLRVLLKIPNFFLYNLFRYVKYACFLYDEMPKLLALNILKESDHLFLLLIFLDYWQIHLFFLLIKDSVSA